MTKRKHVITIKDAYAFADEALSLPSPLGTAWDQLQPRGVAWRAEQLIATLLCDDLVMMTRQDKALLARLNRLEQAMDSLADAWDKFQPLLHRKGTPFPNGAYREPAERWNDFFDGLSQAHQCLYGSRRYPGRPFPGLGGMLRMALKEREEAYRMTDGGLHRQVNRPVAGCLYLALGAILEQAFPGDSELTKSVRGAYRREVLKRANERWSLVKCSPPKRQDPTRFKKPADSFIDSVKKSQKALLKKFADGRCHHLDVDALAGSIPDFPGLFPTLYKANAALTLCHLADCPAIVNLQRDSRGAYLAEPEREHAYLQALVTAAQAEQAQSAEEYRSRIHSEEQARLSEIHRFVLILKMLRLLLVVEKQQGAEARARIAETLRD